MGEGDPLKGLSRGTKALVIVNEFTTRRMEAAELAAVLQRLAPTLEEQSAIVDLVENELLAASYPRKTIEGLIHTLLPNRRQLGPGPGPQVGVTRTRRVHSPFVVPFDDFKFQGSGAQPPPGGRTSAFPVSAQQPAPAPKPPAGPRPKLPPIGRIAPGAAPARPGAPQAAPPQGKAPVKRAAVSAPHPEGHKPPMTLSYQNEDEVFFGGTATGMNVGEVQRAAKPTVLIADDDARIRMIYKIKLEEANYHVVETGDGIQAWKHIREGGLSGIVLDMKIPGYHGLEVLSRMIDAQIFLPVVISSAYDQLGDEFVVATYPKLKYLVKPVAPEKIVEAMNELIEAEAGAGGGGGGT